MCIESRDQQEAMHDISEVPRRHTAENEYLGTSGYKSRCGCETNHSGQSKALWADNIR